MKKINFTTVSTPIIIFCTVPNETVAQNIAHEIITKQLVACITIFPNAVSFFYWKNKLQKENEVQMLLKTDIAHGKMVFDYLKSHHPYQIPELLALSVFYIDNDYLSWINTSLV